MFLFRNLLRLIRYLLCIFIIFFLVFIYLEQRFQKTLLLSETLDAAYKFTSFQQRESQYLDTETLKKIITRYNEAERIHNSREFGTGLNDSVIVIFVHKFSGYLKYLIASLSKVKGIQDVLLIFSHAYYDININILIEKIDFCRVLQIFYPYSIQLYPNKFPGRDNEKNDSCLSNCQNNNAENKYHWWWTANKVFEDLTSVNMSNGNTVIFLNEDQYVLEDFLYMVIYMKKAAKSVPQCEMISLGTIGSKVEDPYRLDLTTWNPEYHSEALGFDYVTWNIIVSHFDLFCLIDASWAQSLKYVSLNRLEGNSFKVISSKVPRSFSTNCGKNGVINCGHYEGIYKALYIQKLMKSNNTPPLLDFKNNIKLIDDVKYDTTDSAWSDVRDREFCSNLTLSKFKKLFWDMRTQFN